MRMPNELISTKSEVLTQFRLGLSITILLKCPLYDHTMYD